MSLKEISLAQLLEATSGTEYFLTFAKLIGHSSNAIFYEGIRNYKQIENISFLPISYLLFLF